MKRLKHFVESHHKYLLFIDILGFSEMVANHPEVIPALYQLIATANVNKHGDFELILFSDTVVVYNRYPPRDPNNRMFTIMFLCEFCQDLFYRLSAIDVFFRAVIVDGDFQHYTLGRATCFFGSSLIDAYLREKQIKSVGAFIHSRCLEQCHVFTTVPHADDLHFLILTKPMESLARNSGGIFPVVDPIVLETVDLLYLQHDLRALQKIHSFMDDPARPPEVREKFLVAWHYLKKSLGTVLEFFESHAFELRSISPNYNWQNTDLVETTRTYPYPLTPQQFGFLLALSYTTWKDNHAKAVASEVLDQLQESGFTGRCEYYHSRRALGEVEVYYVGMALKDTNGKQFGDYDWWSRFEDRMVEALARKQVPLSRTTLSEQASMSGIRKDHDFCGAIMLQQGIPELVIEHPDRLGTSAFTEAVKLKLFKSFPGTFP